MALRDLLLRALVAINKIVSDDDALALTSELLAIVSWYGLDGRKDIYHDLLHHFAKAASVAGFTIDHPENIAQCIQRVVLSEQKVIRAPQDVTDFVVPALWHFVPCVCRSAGLILRLLTEMRKQDCAIVDAASLRKAVLELNNFALYPAEVTAERYERATANTLSDDEMDALSPVELNRLALHAGKQFLCDHVNRRTTKRRIRQICDEPDAKRLCNS